MKLKLILFVLLIQVANVYSQSDVKFLKAFTNDIILDKNYAKYKDYIEYFNGYDSINEDYEKYTKEIFKLYFAEKNIPKTNRNIKVINVTNKDSLLNEKLDLVKNVKHSYYLIYNNNEYITHLITNENGKIISYYPEIIIIKGNQNDRKIKPRPFYLTEDLKNKIRN